MCPAARIHAASSPSVVRQTRDSPRVPRSAVLPTADRYRRRAIVCIPGVERSPTGRHQHRPSSFGRLPSHPSTAAASGRHGTTAGWVRPVGAAEDPPVAWSAPPSPHREHRALPPITACLAGHNGLRTNTPSLDAADLSARFIYENIAANSYVRLYVCMRRLLKEDVSDLAGHVSTMNTTQSKSDV